eukprot:GABV01000844.1.p1 GENE.GABV01000844.1~~GABV01000844.1.p1  ORF type:complete len:130 (+),score=35.83 GABV01000844.1:37-390(+)
MTNEVNRSNDKKGVKTMAAAGHEGRENSRTTPTAIAIATPNGRQLDEAASKARTDPGPSAALIQESRAAAEKRCSAAFPPRRLALVLPTTHRPPPTAGASPHPPSVASTSSSNRPIE